MALKLTIINGTGSDVFSLQRTNNHRGASRLQGAAAVKVAASLSAGGDLLPTIINCIIVRNNHATSGGGLYAQNAGAHLIDCSIIDNTCGAGRGGGLHLRLERCQRSITASLMETVAVNQVLLNSRAYSNITMNNCDHQQQLGWRPICRCNPPLWWRQHRKLQQLCIFEQLDCYMGLWKLQLRNLRHSILQQRYRHHRAVR